MAPSCKIALARFSARLGIQDGAEWGNIRYGNTNTQFSVCEIFIVCSRQILFVFGQVVRNEYFQYLYWIRGLNKNIFDITFLIWIPWATGRRKYSCIWHNLKFSVLFHGGQTSENFTWYTGTKVYLKGGWSQIFNFNFCFSLTGVPVVRKWGWVAPQSATIMVPPTKPGRVFV